MDIFTKGKLVHKLQLGQSPCRNLWEWTCGSPSKSGKSKWWDRMLQKNLKMCHHHLNSLTEKSTEKWQCSKWNGGNISQKVSERLKLKLPISPNFTSMLTGHGHLRTYYHRFHIIEDPTCICNGGPQTIDHVIEQCVKLNDSREVLRSNIIRRGGSWPPTRN